MDSSIKVKGNTQPNWTKSGRIWSWRNVRAVATRERMNCRMAAANARQMQALRSPLSVAWRLVCQPA